MEPELYGGVLTLRIKTDRPPPDAMLAQVITHPCLVVGIADPAVGRVKVLDEFRGGARRSRSQRAEATVTVYSEISASAASARRCTLSL